MVSYTPPAGVSNASDNFAYVVTHGKGGVNPGVVTVQLDP
jgi:hypothetical protein